MGNDSVFEQYHSQNMIVSMIQESQLTSLPISAEEIKKATDKDHILQKVIGKMKKGWPKLRKNVSKELQPYFNRRFQLSSQSGCLLCGQRVIIPTLSLVWTVIIPTLSLVWTKTYHSYTIEITSANRDP